MLARRPESQKSARKSLSMHGGAYLMQIDTLAVLADNPDTEDDSDGILPGAFGIDSVKTGEYG